MTRGERAALPRANHDVLSGKMRFGPMRGTGGAMNLGRLSSAALMLSGISGVLMPRRFVAALDLSAVSNRGVAETRAGLGGTYAALGGWALLSRDPGAQAAVGVTWLGAAAARLASLALDRPRTDSAFWGYLAAEIGFGATALAWATRAATESLSA